MTVAVNIQEEQEFITKEDRKIPEDQIEKKQTVWLCKVLSFSQAKTIEDNVMTMDMGKHSETKNHWKIRTGTQAYKALRKGLKGVRNFRDEDGNIVEFEEKDGVVTDKFLDKIPRGDSSEIANFIIEGKNISEEDSKN